MFGTVFVLHILQKGLVVLGSIGCLVIRIDIRSLVMVRKGSQLPDRIENLFRIEKHSRHWSQLSIMFGKLLSSQLYVEEHVFLSLNHLVSQSSHNDIYRIGLVIVDCENMI